MEEQFARGDSFLHRRDPRGKIVMAVLFIVAVALTHSFAAAWTALVTAFTLLLLGRVSARAVTKRLLVVNSLTLFLWLSLPLSYGGDTSVTIASFNLSADGIRLAALITLKTNTIVLAIIALISTSTIADLGHALDRLGFSKTLFYTAVSYRYIFVIYQEYKRLLRAAKMRCFTPKTNIHTYRTYAFLFGMTLVKSFNRSQRIYQAMQLRGFSGKLLSLHRYTLTAADIVFILVLTLCSLTILIINITC